MKTLTLPLLVAFLYLSIAGSVVAAETNGPPPFFQDFQSAAPKTDKAVTGESSSNYLMFRGEEEKSRRWVISAVIAAALISLLMVLLFLTYKRTCDAITIVHASGMVLVIYATVLVVIIARADEQLTAAVGILGAIAGYLLGKSPTKG